MKIFLFFLVFYSLSFAQTYTLVDLYKLSFSNSEDYEISRLQSKYSDKEVDKSISEFYPKVDITTELMKINEYPVIIDGIEQERRDKRRDTTFTVEQTIYDRNKYYDYKLKSNNFLQSEFEINKKQQELMFDVISYYLDSLLKAKQIELLNQKLKRIDTIVLRAKVKMDSGLISKADYLEAQLQKDEILTQIIKRKLDYKVSKSYLEKLSGVNEVDIKKNINLALFDINNLNKTNKNIEDNLDIQVQKLKLKNSDMKVSKSISSFEPIVFAKYEHIQNDIPES